MMARSGTMASRKNSAAPRNLQRYLSALLLTFSLLLGLTFGQIAGAAAVADQHSGTNIVSPTRALDAEPPLSLIHI